MTADATIVRAGAAVVDITPPAGLAMSGYSARTSPATAAHDPLTARALVVNDTAIVAVDVCGLHEDTCERVRRNVVTAAPHLTSVVVTATHTHGGPAVVPGRLGGPVDPTYLARLESACVEAVLAADRSARRVTVWFGVGTDPGVARNRRRPDGPTDPTLPVLRFVDEAGQVVAVVTSYACHPVVLGPRTTVWTADYPGVVRRELERAVPGSVALFLTGCCGDANTGHSASASIVGTGGPSRTFPTCERLGRRIAQATLDADTRPVSGPTGGRHAGVELALGDGSCWRGRVSVLTWAGVRVVAFPGEPFAATSLAVRAALPGPALVLGYADGCPGYLPPREEYAHGGYEVEEAHLYYGMPAAFAPGCAEQLLDTALRLATTDSTVLA